MAIDLNKQSIIKQMLEEKTVWTSEEIQYKLGISSSWVSKNSVELKLYGLDIQRQVTRAHKEHSNKGVAKNIKDRVNYKDLTFTKEWEADKWIQIRFLVNQFHMLLGVPVPFAIESEERDGDSISSEDYQTLENNFNKWVKDKSINDIYLFLKELKEEILASSKDYNKTSAKRIFIHMFNIIESYPYITLIESNPVLLIQVKSAFKEVHGFEPTDEQVQVIAKAYKFATGSYDKHTVASIQSDAGSSKSTCALVIQHLLYEQIPYITAITNKALNNIKNSKTVSSLLSSYADIEIGDSYKIKLIKAKANTSIIPFIIVDESSQCGMKTRTLLETISEKVLYMGDQEQLPAIMDDQGVDFLYLHTLRTQYRFLQAEDNFQIAYSALNKNKLYNRANKLIQSKIIGSVQASAKFRETKESSAGFERYSDFTGSFSEFESVLKSYESDEHLIITYAQGAVDEINYVVNEGKEIKLNSKVMLVTNQYAVEQFNGFIYRVIQLESTRALCKSIDTGKEFWYKIKDLVLSYAVTTMKIQGSQIEHVLGVIDTMRPLANLDRYVITTRAGNTIRFIQCISATKTQELIIKDADIQPTLSYESIHARLSSALTGGRNNTLYGCAKDLIKLDAPQEEFDNLYNVAISIGMYPKEINSTIASARTIPTTPSKTSTTVKKEPVKSSNIVLDACDINSSPRTTLYYTPVFNSNKTLIGKDQVLTYKEALSYPNKKYIAEQLKGSNRVVIDCDSKETVELFKNYIDLTESYISEEKDSLHLVFTTKHIIPSLHKIGIDLLGNKLFQLRNIKDNKVFNGLAPIPLTQEVLNIFNAL